MIKQDIPVSKYWKLQVFLQLSHNVWAIGIVLQVLFFED